MVEQRLADDVYLDYPVNVLISYHYFFKTDINAMAAGGLRIIGDSGAYSAASQNATIDRDGFYAWVARYRNALLWAAALDVIGDEKASWHNWRTAPEELNLVPTVHYGCEPKAMDRYAERGADLIGLGGMVPFKSEPDRLLRWALKMMRYGAKQWPDVRFHGWGVSHPQLIMNLPWWSIDSSGFGSAYRYARLRAFNPKTGKMVTIALNGTDPAKHARFLRDAYGVSWRAILNSSASNRHTLVRVSVRSAQLTEQFLQRRYGVTPPARLAALNGIGPNVHHADAGPHILKEAVCPPVGPAMVAAIVEKTEVNSLSRDGDAHVLLGPQVHISTGRGQRTCSDMVEATKPNFHTGGQGPSGPGIVARGPHVHVAVGGDTGQPGHLASEGNTP